MLEWLKEMKESRAKFFMVVFLSSIYVSFPESIQINRFISQPKDPQTWKKVFDWFVVPSSACYQGRIGTGGNYCNESCTKDDSKDQYLCRCSHKFATVTYVNNTWMCLENKLVRNKLGCAKNTLFHYEREWHGLYTLSTQPSWGRKTALYKKEASCVLNTSSSWVIGCHGEKIPVDELTNRTKKIFVLEWSNKSKAYYIKVVDPIAILQGRIINLGVSCSQPPSGIKEGCLLFKLEGNITCNLTFGRPELQDPVKCLLGSTPIPATSSLLYSSPSASPIATGTEETISLTQLTTSETESTTSKGAKDTGTKDTGTKDTGTKDTGTNSAVIGITVGCAVVCVISLSALVLFCKRRKSKNRQQETKPAVGNPVAEIHDQIPIGRLMEHVSACAEQDSQSAYQGLINICGQGNVGAGHSTADDNSGNCHLYQSLDKNTAVTAAPDYQNVQTLFAASDYQNVQTLEGDVPCASVHILGSQTESAYEPLKGSETQNFYEPLNERSN
ncbi:uncharacterized protein [Pocillopora verrucosa]|uniref:uncharacterized protein isoform X2 n=1 Tax=Pocillopora verrucosa TaxID=203993 RepID=UPI0033426632